MRGLLLLFFAKVIFSNITFAQTYSQLNKSDTVTISSAIFQKERKIIITKSKELKNGSTNNNCILYLDANFKNLNGIFLQSANNLIANNEIPPSYLIGVIHQDRNTELLEKDKLLKFISEEVIPWLEKEYNISKRITIAGHSFGAYFATYAFLKNNSLFNSCIALSPAYWPNKEDVLKLMDQEVKSNSVGGDFYLLVGDKRWDEISLRDYVFKAFEILNHTKAVRFKFNDLDGFSHNATTTVGFGLGLGFVYDEWEWGNILEEQEDRLKSFPDFWGHLEIKADALFHLKRVSEAKTVYKEALKVVPKDEDLSKKKKGQILKRIKSKIKNCR
ncbi:alpha/beta hydrolase [Sphingobacterium spiritivorum]|uniref:alpha/beta hydrolase n=1 Tax=Sphingobacterium spiritivorum TaxID=258 RepID=UPI003DA308B5